MRLLRARGLADLREVASGSATKGLWLRNRKVGSQVSGIDRSRLHGRRTVGEEDEEESTTERRRGYTVLGFNLGEREEQVVCHASALALVITDDTSGSGDVSLAIFITSVSGSESLASFTNRLLHLSRPSGFRMALDAAERNGRFGRIQCQRGKESSSRGKRKRRVFLCSRTVSVKIEGKVIPASFRKIEGRGTFVG